MIDLNTENPQGVSSGNADALRNKGSESLESSNDQAPTDPSRRRFLTATLLSGLALLGFGKWVTTRQPGGQIEPSHPSQSWLSQHGNPLEKASIAAQNFGNALNGNPEKEADVANNPPKQPLIEQKTKMMDELQKVSDRYDKK
jgi:hypothetical protein